VLVVQVDRAGVAAAVAAGVPVGGGGMVGHDLTSIDPDRVEVLAEAPIPALATAPPPLSEAGRLSAQRQLLDKVRLTRLKMEVSQRWQGGGCVVLPLQLADGRPGYS
jgi:hypothetical protein